MITSQNSSIIITMFVRTNIHIQEILDTFIEIPNPLFLVPYLLTTNWHQKFGEVWVLQQQNDQARVNMSSAVFPPPDID